MSEWMEQAQALHADRIRFVLVTVASVRGSAPREVGAKMIVTRQACSGSIGGGQLEYECTRIAAGMLQEDIADAAAPARFRRRFPLGANLGQCCGGVVDILFEPVGGECRWFDELSRLYALREPAVVVTSPGGRYLVSAGGAWSESGSSVPPGVLAIVRQLLREPLRSASSTELAGQPVLFDPLREGGMSIAIFGAGHVGSACVAALSAIDCRIRWIDSRRRIFPQGLPAQVNAVECADPALEVAAMPAASYYLVMTHSHALDYAICHQVLRRKDFAYCGLIGSISKRRRFEKLMRDAGFEKAALQRLTCPIGVDGIRGKQPAEIAIAVIAELLRTRDAAAQLQGHERHRQGWSVVADSGER